MHSSHPFRTALLGVALAVLVAGCGEQTDATDLTVDDSTTTVAQATDVWTGTDTIGVVVQESFDGEIVVRDVSLVVARDLSRDWLSVSLNGVTTAPDPTMRADLGVGTVQSYDGSTFLLYDGLTQELVENRDQTGNLSPSWWLQPNIGELPGAATSRDEIIVAIPSSGDVIAVDRRGVPVGAASQSSGDVESLSSYYPVSAIDVGVSDSVDALRSALANGDEPNKATSDFMKSVFASSGMTAGELGLGALARIDDSLLDALEQGLALSHGPAEASSMRNQIASRRETLSE